MGFSIWNEEFWLPENTTWGDLKSRGNIVYPQFEELGFAVLVGVVLLFLRLFFESFVFLPIGYYGGFTRNKANFFFI